MENVQPPITCRTPCPCSRVGGGTCDLATMQRVDGAGSESTAYDALTEEDPASRSRLSLVSVAADLSERSFCMNINDPTGVSGYDCSDRIVRAGARGLPDHDDHR